MTRLALWLFTKALNRRAPAARFRNNRVERSLRNLGSCLGSSHELGKVPRRIERDKGMSKRGPGAAGATRAKKSPLPPGMGAKKGLNWRYLLKKFNALTGVGQTD